MMDQYGMRLEYQMCLFAWDWIRFNTESLVTQETLGPRETGIAVSPKWGPKVDPATSKMHVHWSPWILLKSLLSLICPQRKKKGLYDDHESIKRTYRSTEKTFENNSWDCPNGLPRRLDVPCSWVHSSSADVTLQKCRLCGNTWPRSLGR